MGEEAAGSGGERSPDGAVARCGQPEDSNGNRPPRGDEESVQAQERRTSPERLVPTAQPGGRMRRLAGGRQRVVFVRLSPAEEEWIVPKAAAEGLSVQRFLVESALPEGRPSLLARRALYREFFAARRDLHGACTNLNQLAHLGNERRQVPSGVGSSAAEVETAMLRLVELARLLVARPKSSPGGTEG